MAARTTVQVPATPSESLVTHCTSGLEFQFPRTVTPFRGLWRQSCTVIRTVADQVSTPLTAQPSRFPTCMLGAVTVIAIARALLLELASGNFWVAVRMCPLIAAPAVLQLMVRVALAPAGIPGIVCVPTTALPVLQVKERVVPAPGASPVTVCVPIVTPPAVASVRTTLKLLLIFVPPMFWRVTLMVAVLPLPIDAGALRAVTATSFAGAFTETVTELWLLAVLPSG